MTFQESVRSVLTNYAKFDGRARRSEYWWFTLFVVLLSIAGGIVDVLVFSILGFGIVRTILMLALLVPSIAVAIRRLHDTDRDGWWVLLVYGPAILMGLSAFVMPSLIMPISVVVLIGAAVLVYFYSQEGTKGENRFGPKV